MVHPLHQMSACPFRFTTFTKRLLQTNLTWVFLTVGSSVAAAHPVSPTAPELAPEPPQTRTGPKVSVFVGVHHLLGDWGKGLDSGPRIGGSLGGRLSRAFSLNAEFVFDDYRQGDAEDATGAGITFSLVPTFHIVMAQWELLLAPKVGFLTTWSDSQTPDGAGESSATGYMFGANVGAAFNVGPIKLGPLLTFERQTMEQACSQGPGEEGKTCGTVSELRQAAAFRGPSTGNLVSLNFALWF